METRTCSRCDLTKPIVEFNKSSRGRGGHAYHCKACQRARDEEPRNRFSSMRAAIRAEEIFIDITLEQWEPLIKQPCYYCGWPLPKTGRGMDRIDPLGGYTLTNVVPCCGACNSIKGRFITGDEFKRHIAPGVAAIKAERTAKGEDPLTYRTAKNQRDGLTQRMWRKKRREERMAKLKSDLV